MNSNNITKEQPGWLNASSIIETLDAREMLQAGMHPLAEVIRRTTEMKTGQIFELITPFPPMPLIEKIKANGFQAYSRQVAEAEIHTYFFKE